MRRSPASQGEAETDALSVPDCMNPHLDKLQPYPFEKLMQLKQGCTPPLELAHIALSIGEPKHAAPAFVLDGIRDQLDQINRYPLTKGMVELRQAIADWLQSRFALGENAVDVEHQVLPVNGTREALFAFAQAVIEPGDDASVLMPNPFYQIYEGATLLAGALPQFLNTTADNGYLPDFDAVSQAEWQRCQLLYLCTPGNPTGAVMSQPQLIALIEKAQQHDFIIASDECYSEIYFDENRPPPGLLQAARACGNDDYKRCVVFHSLSKRSNLPGLRSGFVAGDADVLKKFLLYRTYHGCAMPPPFQLASIQAWQDEAHVRENRECYRRKFDAVIDILQAAIEVHKPDAGFYLWLKTPTEDTAFARDLFDSQNVMVLPGSFLSRQAGNINPGANHVRMALVAPLDECIDAANRIRIFIETL